MKTKDMLTPRVRVGIAAVLAGLVLMVSVPVLRSQQAAVGFTLDFEEGSLRGWTQTGTAFKCQPTYGDNAAGRGRPARPQGRYWVGTYECYRGDPDDFGSRVQKDGPQGVLTSHPFTIPGGRLSFLIGGGSSSATRVELVIGDPVEPNSFTAFSASGKNQETMERVSWDLSKHTGRTGRIRIVDQSSGPWGHINVDDFRFGLRMIPVQPRLTQRVPSNADAPSPSPDDVAPAPTPPTVGSISERPRIVQIPPVTVPDVVGRTTDVAQRILANANLRMRIARRDRSRQRPGTVIEQSPAARTRVQPGSTVQVVIARGVRVPNLEGIRVQEAEARLQERGLQLGRQDAKRSDRSLGTILGQSPEADAVVSLGARVDVVVAEGVKVPDVERRRVGVAEGILREEGLLVGRRAARPSEQEPGTVVAQTPRAGAVVPLRTQVDLVVAQGIAVPNLVGLTPDQARTRLGRVELQLGQVMGELSERPLGTILRQDPSAGREVPLRTAVRVWVAQGVEVPELVRLDLRQAEALLEEKRLRLGQVTEELSERPAGTILRQDPSAGREVPLRTAVRVWVAQAVEVPELVRLDLRQAEALLEEKRLRLGQVTEELSERPAGTILRQDPSAGREVPLRTAVRVWVAQGVEVPQLVGQERQQAQNILREVGLAPGQVDTEVSSNPVGTVFRQVPLAGATVPLHSEVRLVVAEGVEVPDVRGRTQEEARDTLENLLGLRVGLALGPIIERLSERPIRTIITQNPLPGARVPLDTPVRITLAQGVEVPGLVGRRLTEAEDLLGAVGLTLGQVELQRSTGEPGTILKQTPSAQVVVPLRTVVEVVVEEGVQVPALSGRSREDAEALLGGLGLQVGSIQEREIYRWPGAVLEQEPKAGTPVAASTSVNLVIGIVPLPVIVIGAMGGLTLLGGGVQLVRGRLRTRRRKGRRPSGCKIVPRVDPGVQTLETPGPVGAGFDVRLRTIFPEAKLTIELKGPIALPGRTEAGND